MLLYFSIDCPTVTHNETKMVLNNQAEDLKIAHQSTHLARKIWHGLAEKTQGKILNEVRAEIKAMFPAESLSDVLDAQKEYSEALGGEVFVGVGIELLESDRALAAAIKTGASILTYSDYVEHCLQDKDEDKELDELFGKNEPTDLDFNESDDPNYEAIFHQHAARQEAVDYHQHLKTSGHLDHAKQQVVAALKMLKEKAPELAIIHEQAPEVFHAVTGLTNSITSLANALRQHQAMEKAEEAAQEQGARHIAREALEKVSMALSLPEQSEHVKRRRVVLPVGAVKKDNKIKVMHYGPNGEKLGTGWVQAKKGLVTGIDGSPAPASNPDRS